ncbi:MAG: Sir2 family NAD-dependent protein deacetylase [Elusimicrobia bacterium]|nr:Sir2 family NAD-dependent protein deacetylase [Elusimicrobiota bacterium]
MEENLKQLRELIRKSGRILVFTGAGISTGSGIPDFRGPDGVWTKREPVLFQEFMDSEEKRKEYWQYKADTFEAFKAARPNDAHKALVRLEKMDKLQALVTQNIDNLHRAAGTSNGKLIELHGTALCAECVVCYDWTPMAAALGRFLAGGKPPKCACGGRLKPAVVMFGESLPQAELGLAFKAAQNCDLAISIGSTLSVEPAASVPLSARAAGKPYAIINRGSTAHDQAAVIKIDADAVAVLPELI